jgi:hypothetical protein
MPRTSEEAQRLLVELNTPARLRRHVQLVGEAAESILAAAAALGARLDADLVRAGVAVHDIGKIWHSAEFSGPGSSHELTGERALLERGWDPDVARMCWTHARWSDRSCSLEELLVALSDKLWKGVRVADLEERVIDALAIRLGKDRWDFYTRLTDAFDDVAASGPERLERSVQEAT